ncbi:hypothetical protein ABK040_005900 [Willaertia magna]
MSTTDQITDSTNITDNSTTTATTTTTNEGTSTQEQVETGTNNVTMIIDKLEQPGNGEIFQLPIEMIENIFSYLHVIPLMLYVYPSCKKFNQIINESISYWKQVEFFGITDGYQDDDNYKIKTKNTQLKERQISKQELANLIHLLVPKFGDRFREVYLYFSDSFNATELTLNLISTHCKGIKTLKVDTINSLKEGIKGIVPVIENNSSTLEELTIQGGFPTDKFDKLITSCGKTLKSLYLEEKDGENNLLTIPSKLLKETEGFTALEHLYLGGVKCFGDFLAKSFSKCEKLKSIVFDQCGLDVTVLDDFFTQHFHPKSLQHLEILYCTVNTDVVPTMDLWRRIFEKCNQLVNLFIYSCTVRGERNYPIDLGFKDDDLVQCLNYCKQIECLDIRNCTLEGKFFKELHRAKNLWTLIVESKNWNLSNVLPEHNDERTPVYSNSLKHLCMYGEKCDSSLEKPIANLFPNIESVHLDKFA